MALTATTTSGDPRLCLGTGLSAARASFSFKLKFTLVALEASGDVIVMVPGSTEKLL
jgi:hypothetical protein